MNEHDNQDEVKRLKEEIEAMKKQQEKMFQLLQNLNKNKNPEESIKANERDDESGELQEQIRSKFKRKMNTKTKPDFEEKMRAFEETMESFDSVVENFVASILESVVQSVAKSTEHIFSDSDFQINKRPFVIEKIGRQFKYKIKPEEIDDFAKKMSAMLSPLTDPHRIKILKALEQSPKYHDEISGITGAKGGQFKHHMTILMEKGFVIQERYRGRYILTKSGRSFLKMLEVLYIQAREKEHRNDDDKNLNESEQSVMDKDAETTEDDKNHSPETHRENESFTENEGDE